MPKHILLFACFVLFHCFARAQYMGDTSSIYRDAWSDGTNIYLSASVAGSMGIHGYKTEARITSPSGRYSSMTSGSYSSGYVSTTTTMAVNGETGDYQALALFPAFCSQSNLAFGLGAYSDTISVGEVVSYWKDPITYPLYCYWQRSNCLGSSTPTCTAPSFNFIAGGCPPFVRATHGTLKFLGNTTCLPGFVESWPGPGICK